ncbi:acyl-CoA dehydrogenase family protein [Paraburkholderia bannensis]|uniref:acyl-CoA dehydrogenase family protein n=1 Tax=Paraburkholderia bannensis TaxID=765414 RepID=UPI002AC335FE|nr:acyl-CoA dehydrogenase family protein [Paraburkholderia bannensis]
MYSLKQTSEDREWIEKASALKEVFALRARQVDEAGCWPQANWDDIVSGGFLRLGIPKEYGGYAGEDAGFSHVCHTIVEIFASACGSTGWIIQNQFHCHGLVAALGTSAQKQRIFSDIVANGAGIASVGSEVKPGRSAVSPHKDGKITFTAEIEPIEGGFVVNGFKGFTSGGGAAKYLLFWGVAPGTDDPDHGVCVFLIELPNPGVEFVRGWDEAIGIRASLSGGAMFKDVFIPWKNVLGEPGDFNQIHPYTFELAYASHSLGSAQGIYDEVRQSVADRVFLQEDDVNLYVLGEMAAYIAATRSQLWHAQHLYDEHKWGEASHATLLGLHMAKTTARMVAQKAFDVVGTRADFHWNPIPRLARDINVATLHTRESFIMKTVAKSEISRDFFAKAKYGKRLPAGVRKTWAELGFEFDRDAA